ncbi:MAG: ferritin-like domain-containing protein [Chlamydiales bacterium]|nr:ferritin-like domain-containing protein [Chlamydiales bacterium]
MEQGIRKLLLDELHDILSSEEQIVQVLPDMVKASDSADLKEAFQTHLAETKEQIKRLTQVFKLLGEPKKAKFCKATKGLVDECRDVLKEMKTKSPLRDAALISKAQRIEHYEMACYGTVRTYAKELNLKEVATLLQTTLNEEGHANRHLTRLAEGGLFRKGINILANSSQDAKKAPKPKAKVPVKAAAASKRIPTAAKKKVIATTKSVTHSKPVTKKTSKIAKAVSKK